MEIMNKQDYKLLENLLMRSEFELKSLLADRLIKMYGKSKVKISHDYMYAIGEIPVAVVAHLDTVFSTPPSLLLYDKDKNMMWCPGGAGFDDRAGVFSILKILNTGLRPHVIFTQGEEMGGIGSSALSKEICPFNDLKFIIQMDRRGTNDCVFYDCDNKDFVNFIESYGFSEAYGSFTDISWLCPSWGIAGVNLSVGYEHEHTNQEVLYVQPLKASIKKVIKLLREIDKAPYFKYVERLWYNGGRLNQIDLINDEWYDCCDECGKPFIDEFDCYPILGEDGKERLVCGDCLVKDKKLEYCDNCFELYRPSKEVPSDQPHLCPNCIKKLKEEGEL